MSSNQSTNVQGISFDRDAIMRLLDGVRDPIRIEIIFLIGSRKSMNVGDIAAKFNISRPAISHHLKVLKNAGIVRSEKNGQENYYHIDRNLIVSGLRNLADAFENCCPE